MLEFKLDAQRLIGAGQSIAGVAATLGLADQTLHNWIKAQREGRLGGPGSKPVSPEQMKLARRGAAACQAGENQDGAGHHKNSGSVLRAGIDVKY